MTKRKKSRALKCLAFFATICCAFSAVFMRPVSAESGSVQASDLFVTTTTKNVGKTNTVTAGEYGISFDMGTTVDKKNPPSTVSFGNQTENMINGVFKGDFGMKYQLTDYFGYTTKDEMKAGAANTSTTNAHSTELVKIGGHTNTVLTFRIKPVSGEQYIDINLVTFYKGDPQYCVYGHLVVAYYDGSTTQYRTVPFVIDGPKENKAFQDVVFTNPNNVFSSKLNHFSPSSTNPIDWATSVVAVTGNQFLMSTNETGFKLQWEDDVLKIVGTNYASGSAVEHTYAAFDGVDFSGVTTSKTLTKAEIDSIEGEGGNGVGRILYNNQREFLINGCGLPKVDGIFGNGYTVSVINHGEQITDIILNSGKTYNADTSTGYTIKSITGSKDGVKPETTYFNAATVSKPAWLVEQKTATVTVDGTAETINLPIEGSTVYYVPESAKETPAGKVFSYFEDSDGKKYMPGDSITLRENMSITLTSVFVDEIGTQNVFGTQKKLTIAGNGASFDLGNTVTKSGSGTTEDPYKTTVNTDGTRTENKLNGKFSGDLSLNFNVNDVWNYANYTVLKNYTGKTSAYDGYTTMLKAYGAYLQSIMTFRITPASGNEYIDIHVVMHTRAGTYQAYGKFVVDYVDAESNHYIRTIDYNNIYGYSSYFSSTNWEPTASVCRTSGSDTDPASKFSSSTLKLVWEGDVLKIVGQEEGGIDYTYAAFDGALYDTESGLYFPGGTLNTSYIETEKAKGADDPKEVLYTSYANFYVNGCGLPKVADKFKENYTVSVFNYGTANLKTTASVDAPKTILDINNNNKTNQVTNHGKGSILSGVDYSKSLASSYTIKSVNGSSFTTEAMPMPYWYDNFAYITLGSEEIKVDAGNGSYIFPEYTDSIAAGKVFSGYYYAETQHTYQPGDTIQIEKDKTYTFTIKELDLGTVTVDGVKQTFDGNSYTLPAFTENIYGWVVSGGAYTGKVYKAGETLTVNVGDSIIVTSLKITDFALDNDVTARITNTAADSGLRFTLKFSAPNLTALPAGVSFTVTVINSEYATPIMFTFDSDEYLIAETDSEGNPTGNFSFVSTIVNFTQDAHKTGTLTVSASASVTYADNSVATVDAESLTNFTVSSVASEIKASEKYAALSETQKAVVDGWIVANN